MEIYSDPQKKSSEYVIYKRNVYIFKTHHRIGKYFDILFLPASKYHFVNLKKFFSTLIFAKTAFYSISRIKKNLKNDCSSVQHAVYLNLIDLHLFLKADRRHICFKKTKTTTVSPCSEYIA